MTTALVQPSTAEASAAEERWRALAEHRPALLRYARGRTVTLMDAEDAVAEALRRAFEQDGLEAVDALPWLRVVTRNLCIDLAGSAAHARKRRRYGVMLALAEPTAEERACDRAEANWVTLGLRELPESQRAAIMLKAEGHDISAIAQRLGVSDGAAESLLSRARAALRRRLRAASAAALVGWAAALVRRAPRTVAIAPVAMAAVLLNLSPGPIYPFSGGAGSERRASQTTQTPAVDTITAARPIRAAESRASGSTERLTRTVKGGGEQAPAPIVPAPSRPAHRLAAGPVTVTDEGSGREDEDRTFVQSVQDCLNGGLTISPSEVGCKGSS